MNTISFVLAFLAFCFSANTEKQSGANEILKNLFLELETYKSVSLSVDILTELCSQRSFSEYSEVVAEDEIPKSAVANLTINSGRTRFITVPFHDHSRVKLSTDDDSASDYINANYVDGWNQKNAFILTQAPMHHTVLDFWKMIWEQKCLVISMAANFIEDTAKRCFRYWNTTEGRIVTFGYFHVKTVSVYTTENYELSRLVLTNFKVSCCEHLSLQTRVLKFYNFFENRPENVEMSFIAILQRGKTTQCHRHQNQS
jgi:protein tyrosine phosphatase